MSWATSFYIKLLVTCIFPIRSSFFMLSDANFSLTVALCVSIIKMRLLTLASVEDFSSSIFEFRLSILLSTACSKDVLFNFSSLSSFSRRSKLALMSASSATKQYLSRASRSLGSGTDFTVSNAFLSFSYIYVCIPC